MTQNQRIVLNIVATYGRSLYSLAIGLLTAKWALQALGHTDFGVYGVVGGLTAFISYFNGILGSAIGRFYAVTVGRERMSDSALAECQMWFTTAVVIHTLIPMSLMLIGYPVGTYVIRCYLDIPPDRIVSSLWVWRFVCVTSFLGMVSVPLTSMYTAKQYIAELTIYSFITTTLNALFLYYMVSHPGFWLTRYAFWQCLLSCVPSLIIGTRAFYLFPECRIQVKYLRCWNNVKKLFGFALWNAWGGLVALLRTQGSAVLINLYFGPIVNAGMAIGTSISGQCNALAGSMHGAFSPAIYNAWGAKEFEKARSLAYLICRLGTLFVLVFAIPLILEINEVLRIWLENPPAFASGFCVCVLAMFVVDRVASGQQITVNANGKIALYQAFLGTSQVLTLPIAWIMIFCGVGPYAVGIAMVVTMSFNAVGRVVLAKGLVGMSARIWLVKIVLPLIFIVLVSIGIGFLPHLFLRPSLGRIVVTTFISEGVLLPLAWFMLFSISDREWVMNRIRTKLHRL